MGLRLWIKTEKEPTFSLRVKWQMLNQQDDDGYWFFQDEWREDISLYRVAGFRDDDPDAILQKMYIKDQMSIINRLISITPDDIDNFFLHEWERPVIYWDMHRTIGISYLEAKLSYIKSLYEANIIEIKNIYDIDESALSDKLPPWYYYRYAGPDEKRILRIPGKISKYI